MKRKILGILLAVCMAVTGPAAVSAAGIDAAASAEAAIDTDAAVEADAATGMDAMAGAAAVEESASANDNSSAALPDSLSLDGPTTTYVANPYAPAGDTIVPEEKLAGTGEWYEQKMPSTEVDSTDKIGKTIRDYLLQRESTFEIKLALSFPSNKYPQEIYDIADFAVQAIRGEALAHTGLPNEGDYLSYQFGGYSSHWAAKGLSVRDNVMTGTLCLQYNFTLYTTSEEEEAVTEKLGEVMGDLDLDGKSDYEKVKAIHDYICQNVTYDYEHLGNETYKTQYTAYGALIDHTSVCQGYAVLFYSMCLEAGIDARVITGTAVNQEGSERHAWNIVKLGGQYYYVDVTWDDPTNPYDPSYYCWDYFLKGEDTMGRDHFKDPEYKDETFTTAYPTSNSDYVRSYYDDFSDDEPSLVKNSLLLSGQIGVNFYLKLPEIPGCDYTDSYMEFIVNGDTANAEIDRFDPEHRNSDGRLYGFTGHVNSIEMADSIRAIFHYTVDGTEYTKDSEYTVEDYLTQLLSSAETNGEELRTLIQAINDYGYHAQLFLSQYSKKPWTLGTDHVAMKKYYKESYSLTQNDLVAFATQKSLQAADLQSVSLSLTLDTDTAINLYLRPQDNYKGTLSAKLLVGETETPLKVTRTSDGRYRLTISSIAAHLLGQMFSITVTTATGDSTLSVSTLSYAYTCMDANDPARNVMSALYDYYTAAVAYKNVLETQAA